jgi:hypothetical protein
VNAVTTVARQPRAQVLPPEPDAARTVVIRWSIARAAAAGAWPHLIAPAGPPVLLEWHIGRSPDAPIDALGSARLSDTAREAPIPVLCLTAPARIIADHGMEHIDIPGLLSATIHSDGRVLYARTSLLGAWGLRGGRYQVAD